MPFQNQEQQQLGPLSRVWEVPERKRGIRVPKADEIRYPLPMPIPENRQFNPSPAQPVNVLTEPMRRDSSFEETTPNEDIIPDVERLQIEDKVKEQHQGASDIQKDTLVNGTQKEVSIPLRSAVITLRKEAGWTYQRIHELLDLPLATVKGIYLRASQRAGNDADLKRLLAHVEDIERPGRPVKIEEGSNMSVEIRHTLLEYPDVPWNRLLTMNNWGINKSTLIKIAEEHACCDKHPGSLVRKTISQKPFLSEENKAQRREFCKRMLILLDEGYEVFSTDESIFTMGGDPHKRQKVTTLKGVPAEEDSRSNKKAPFKLMVWGGVSSVPKATRPIHVWLPPTKQDRVNEGANTVEKLNQINEASSQRRGAKGW